MDFGSGFRQSKAHRSRRPRSARVSQGFTLIELMVVLAVMGIFAAIAVPSFSKLIHKNSVSAAANELFGLLQYARGEAVTRSTNVTIKAPSSSNTAWNGDVAVTTAAETLRQIGAGGFQSGVVITTAVGDIIFSHTGSASNAACFKFTYSGDTTIDTQFVAVQGSGRVTAPSTTAPTGECS